MKDEGKKNTIATDLVEMAEAQYRLCRGDDGEPVAIPHQGPNIAHQLRGRSSLRARLAADFAREHGKAPSAQALADALLVIEGRAVGGERVSPALRFARTPAGVVVDLGDESGAAVVVTPEGWALEDRSPRLFRRTGLTGTLPHPEEGGSLDSLAELLNVEEAAWPVLRGWLVSAFLPEIPHPIVLFRGPHGAGKSSAARMVAELIDPSPAPLRSAPQALDDWAVQASGSTVVALDNLSSIPEWLSDTLCRAATGDGLVRRRLYSDSDLSVLAFRRVILLTSIDPGAIRGDLADRLAPIDLWASPPVPAGSTVISLTASMPHAPCCSAPCSICWPRFFGSCPMFGRPSCPGWRISLASWRRSTRSSAPADTVAPSAATWRWGAARSSRSSTMTT